MKITWKNKLIPRIPFARPKPRIWLPKFLNRIHVDWKNIFHILYLIILYITTQYTFLLSAFKIHDGNM